MMNDRTPEIRTRNGFSVVEVLVALIILTVGVLGLASTTIYAVRATKYGDITTERTAALQSVIEGLRAMDYNSVANGSETIGRFDISWTTVTSSRSKLVTLVTTGPGLKSAGGGPPLIRPSVADTFEYRITR